MTRWAAADEELAEASDAAETAVAVLRLALVLAQTSCALSRLVLCRRVALEDAASADGAAAQARQA